MAGSDKNARRSDTSGSTPEPSQPISKAESSEVAGQLLNSLKAAEKPFSALSHETRLGMAVITILFCAFCFLVYHKIDLHEKQRQLASIQPNGAAAETHAEATAAEAVAIVASQSPEISAETIDPLISRDDLSQLSPFADDAMAATDSSAVLPGDPTNEQNLLSEPMSAMAEPVDSASVDQSMPAPSDESSMPAFDATASMPVQELSAESLPENFAGALSSGMTEVAASADSETGAIDQAFPSVAEEPNELKSVAATPSATTGEEPPAFVAAEETPLLNVDQNEIPVPDQSGEAARPSESLTEFAAGSGESIGSAAIAEEPAEKEPVLIAMVEPQGQQDGFSGGFSADGFTSDESTSGVTGGRAPVSEPQDSFSSFDSEPAQPRMSAGTPTSTSGGGFNAVTQPGGRASSGIRTAAGSGAEADGKFSLAAFNYQNTNVEAAPDDGSTFDSIKVQAGDNYSKISKRVYGTTRYFSALAVFNQHRIPEPKNMRPGMIVLTPPADVLEQRYPQLFEDMKPRIPEPAEFLELEDGTPAYRVGERETLSEISQRFLGRSSRWVEIYRMNQTIVQDPNRLKPGIILALPADATEVHVSP
ncbi:MAG: LysM peptidoglycan-binding domain-containing protein [Planctomycetota bacterium]